MRTDWLRLWATIEIHGDRGMQLARAVVQKPVSQRRFDPWCLVACAFPIIGQTEAGQDNHVRRARWRTITIWRWDLHGVDVGKVKSVRLVNAHSVGIVLSVDKTAPVTSASVATITSRGLATRGFTGYVYIALEDVGINSRPLVGRPGEAYPIIPTAPSKVVTLDTTINQYCES
jgi:hypothetical protein